jgi:hypothetical protein
MTVFGRCYGFRCEFLVVFLKLPWLKELHWKSKLFQHTEYIAAPRSGSDCHTQWQSKPLPAPADKKQAGTGATSHAAFAFAFVLFSLFSLTCRT